LMSFQSIFCQDKAIAILQKAYSLDKWAHAYVFAGPDGVGKAKTARAWARLLLCERPVTAPAQDGTARHDGCGTCRSCRLVEAGSHPDLNLVYKELKEFTEDGKGAGPPVELGVNVIRKFLIVKATAKPSMAHRKVFIVSEAERLSTESQNAMLKVLEEPPADSSIILLCTRLDKLLPTVRSRCQILRFGLVDHQIVVERLRSMGLDGPAAACLAGLAQGSLGAACTFGALELDGAGLVETHSSLVARLARCDLAEVLDLAQDCVERAKAIAEHWARLDEATSKSDLSRRALRLVMWMLLLAIEGAMRPLASQSSPGRSSPDGTASPVLSGRLGPEQAAERIEDGFEALRWIEAGVNERLVFERFLLRVVSPGIMPIP
jgi:DNA polymerase-3 subunit delta'